MASSSSNLPRQSTDIRRRRTQEERSSETRLKLLTATVDLLIERGYSRLTVDDVSSRAGVTNGARAHHYATKLDLMVETFRHLQGPVQAEARGAAEEASSGEDPLGAFLDHSISIFLTRDAIAFNELLVGARTDAALQERIAPLIDLQHEDVHTPWADMLIARGFPADQVRPMMTATMFLMRGIVTDPLISIEDRNIQSLLAFWRGSITLMCAAPRPSETMAARPSRNRKARADDANRP